MNAYNNIISVIKPTIIINQIFGYFPYVVEQSNHKVIFKYSVYRKYLIAPAEMSFTILILTFLPLYSEVPYYNSLLSYVVDAIFGVSTVLTAILISIKQFANAKLQKEMYKKVIQLDEVFQKSNMCKNYRKLASKNIFFLMLDLVLVTVYTPIGVACLQ